MSTEAIIVLLVFGSISLVAVVSVVVLDFLDFRMRIKAEEDILQSRLAKRRARLLSQWNKTYGNN